MVKEELTIDQCLEVDEALYDSLAAFSISDWAKAITVEVFRNGPVEDMHAAGKLSDADMKVLNKHMVNKIAQLMTLWENEDFLPLKVMLGFARNCATEWDDPEIDEEEVEKMRGLFSYEDLYKFLKMNGGTFFRQPVDALDWDIETN